VWLKLEPLDRCETQARLTTVVCQPAYLSHCVDVFLKLLQTAIQRLHLPLVAFQQPRAAIHCRSLLVLITPAHAVKLP
jgi:hypothetical protein